MMRPDLDSAGARDLTGYLDDDGVIRRCIALLGPAMGQLLGNQSGPAYAEKLREVGKMLRDASDVCEKRAAQVDYVDSPHAGSAKQRVIPPNGADRS